jgi:hypothetical protein
MAPRKAFGTTANVRYLALLPQYCHCDKYAIYILSNLCLFHQIIRSVLLRSYFFSRIVVSISACHSNKRRRPGFNSLLERQDNIFCPVFAPGDSKTALAARVYVSKFLHNGQTHSNNFLRQFLSDAIRRMSLSIFVHGWRIVASSTRTSSCSNVIGAIVVCWGQMVAASTGPRRAGADKSLRARKSIIYKLRSIQPCIGTITTW